MPAYVIAYAGNVRDAEVLAEYRRRNTDAVANHGGRFLARGGEVQVLEGPWPHERCVIMEFDDVATARRLVRVGRVRAAQGHAPGRERHAAHPRRRGLTHATRRGARRRAPQRVLRHAVHDDAHARVAQRAPASAPTVLVAAAVAAAADEERDAAAAADDAEAPAPRGSDGLRRPRGAAPHDQPHGAARGAQPPRRPARLRPRGERTEAIRAVAAGAGSAPRIALRSSVCVPSVKARKFGSKPNATVPPGADRLVDDRRGPAQRGRAVRVARDEEVVRARGRVAQRHERVRALRPRSASPRTSAATGRRPRAAGSTPAVTARISAPGELMPAAPASESCAEEIPTAAASTAPSSQPT